MAKLTVDDLKTGHTYRAKRFSEIFGYTNDRTIIWMGEDKGRQCVQYDSDTVGTGQNYPMMTVDGFLKWAASDITEATEAPNAEQD